MSKLKNSNPPNFTKIMEDPPLQYLTNIYSITETDIERVARMK